MPIVLDLLLCFVIGSALPDSVRELAVYLSRYSDSKLSYATLLDVASDGRTDWFVARGAIRSLCFRSKNLTNSLPILDRLYPSGESASQWADYQLEYHTGESELLLPLVMLAYPGCALGIGLSMYNHVGGSVATQLMLAVAAMAGDEPVKLASLLACRTCQSFLANCILALTQFAADSSLIRLEAARLAAESGLPLYFSANIAYGIFLDSKSNERIWRSLMLMNELEIVRTDRAYIDKLIAQLGSSDLTILSLSVSVLSRMGPAAKPAIPKLEQIRSGPGMPISYSINRAIKAINGDGRHGK